MITTTHNSQQLTRMATDLRLACMRISRRVRFESSHDVAPHQFSVMCRLEEAPRTPGELADIERVAKPSMTRTVAALVERGLVQRVADESDGRASRLVVTDDGHDALAALRLEREGHFERVTADWSVDDLTTFTTLFGRLLDDFAKALPGVSDVCAPTDLPREN